MTKLSELNLDTEVRVDDWYFNSYTVWELIDLIKDWEEYGAIRIVKLKDIPYEPTGQIWYEDICERLDEECSEWSEKNPIATEDLKTCLNNAVAVWRAKYKDSTRVYDDSVEEIENDITPVAAL